MKWEKSGYHKLERTDGGVERSVEWVAIAIRSMLSILVLFLITKLLGKRQITQLSLFEYIVGITIGNLAAHVSLDQGKWYLGLVALAVWASVSFTIEWLTLKSKAIRDIVDGKGTVLIQDGKVLEDNLKKERLTIDEMMEQLRKKNVFRAADVEFAVMETSGEVSVLLKSEHQPITPSHLGVKPAPQKQPEIVIMDGKFMDESLAAIGLNRQWLLTELEKLGVTLDNVFLGQVDTYGQLTLDLYDDKLEMPAPQHKASLLATLKKCEADIEMFALSTDDAEAKAMYTEASSRLEQVISELKPLLKG